jgi:uncharacterized protein YbaP (TraB family)
MKKWTFAALALSLSILTCAQQTNQAENTLLWKISGKGLEKPSYLFGTIHLLCADDAVLSDNMKKAIKEADEVYFEIDMSNMMMIGGGSGADDMDKMMEMLSNLAKDMSKLMEMMEAVNKMKMNGDTTFRDLMSEADYKKVKKYFQENAAMIPFDMLETFKPILAVSVIQGGSMECENATMMEQVIMDEASKNGIKTNGLETLAYQAGILDSIPYKQQAEELIKYINASENASGKSEMDEMWKAYNDQDLKKLEDMMLKSDIGIERYTEILLYRRNENWVKKLETIMPGKSLVIAVGAGHLPGRRGVIDLLRKAGYTVTPVENKKVSVKNSGRVI